ncbi:GNAT family N-acetyltransferase, partial [Pseudomonas sp. GW531-E2]
MKQAPGPTPETAALTVRALPGLKEIGAAEWDACAFSSETLAAGDETHNPFLSYAFLSALEDSGCVS